MRYAYTVVTVALAAVAVAPVKAESQLRPAPSGRATSEVTLNYPQGQAPAGAQALTIRLDYGQPHLRGRVLHTDSLVPYDKVWRTGANNATTLTTGADLVIGGTTLPAGSYVLYTLPSRAGWKLIFQKSAGQTADHDPTKDIARVDLRHTALSTPMESLTMWLIPSTAPGKGAGELRIAWGRNMLSTEWSLK